MTKRISKERIKKLLEKKRKKKFGIPYNEEDSSLNKTEEEMDRESKIDDEIGTKTAELLLDINCHEAKRFLELAFEEPDIDLFRTMRRTMLSVDKRYLRSLELIEKKIADYERWIKKVNKYPIMSRLRSKNLTDQQIRDTLDEITSRNLDDDTIRKANQEFDETWGWEYRIGGHSLEKILELREKDENFLKNMYILRGIVNEFRDIFKEGNIIATQQYVSDFANELKKCNPFRIPGPELGEKTNLVYSIVNHAERAQPILEIMRKNKDTYLKIMKKYQIEVLGLLKENDIPRPELTELVVRGLEHMEERGVAIKTVYELVNCVPHEGRLVLFEHIRDNPNVVSIFRNLRNVQITAREFADFLLDYASLNVLPLDRSLLSIIEDVVRMPSQKEAGACLLVNGEQFAFSNNSKDIYQIAKKHATAHKILNDYFEASELQEQNKANLILRLGLEGIPPQRYKQIKGKIDELSDEGLAEINSIKSYSELEKAILTHSSDKKSTKEGKSVKKHIRSSWYETLIKSADEEKYELISKTYHSLSPDYINRLREVWVNCPESLFSFCQHVVRIGASSVFQMLLKDSHLFSEYRKRLQDEDFCRSIEQIVSSQDRNPYRVLIKILSNEAEHFRLLEDRPVDIEEKRPSLSDYKRVIVACSGYSGEAKIKIRNSLGIEVEFIETRINKRYLPSLRSDDLMIFITSSQKYPNNLSSHSAYFILKQYAKSNDIDFYHFNHAGYKSLINLFQNVQS